MMSSISRRERVSLVAGVTTIGLLVVASRGLPAAREWRARSAATLATQRERVAFVRGARSRLQLWRDSIDARRTRLAALNANTITANSPAAASATLGALVENIADAASVKVSSLELRSDTLSAVSTHRLSLRLSAEGDVAGVEAFLRGVDRHGEPMIIRELTVSQSDPTSPDDRAEILHFSATIDGLALILASRAR